MKKGKVKKAAKKLFKKNRCPANCKRVMQSCAFRKDVVINCWLEFAIQQMNKKGK